MKLELYPHQRDALMSGASEVLYGGALGGGKSYLARVSSIVYSVEIPGLITYLFRRTFKEVLANHVYTPGGFLEMLSELMDKGDVTWNKSDNAFTWWNGSRIQLAHSQYESDIFSHQGAQIGYLIVDEAQHFTPDMIRFIRTRVRLGSLNIPAKWKGKFPRILYTGNPGGVGHHYLKSNFVDFGAGHVFRAPVEEGGMLRQYIPSKLADNVILLRNDPEYSQRVRGMGSAELVEAMIEGDWSKMEGGMFSDVWLPKRANGTPCHVIPPFDVPYTWTITRGYDYGSSAPAACCWFAESDGMEHETADGGVLWFPKGEVIQIGELYMADKRFKGLKLPPEEQARRIKQWEQDQEIFGRVMAGPADNSIFHKEPGRRSIADEMSSEGIFFVRGDKSPGSRVTGAAVMRQLLTNSRADRLERPGFRVTSNCTHTIRTVPNLERSQDNQEDVDSKQEDHIWDVIRYRILMANLKVHEVPLFGT